MIRSLWRRIKSLRGRFNLYHAGIGLLFVTGILVASLLLSPATRGKLWWIEIFPNLAVAFFGALVALLLMYASRREMVVVKLFDWLRGLDNMLADLSSPLNSEKLYPAGARIAELFPGNAGWIMWIRAPGLLIRGEVKRRRYLPVMSEHLEGGWNISWAENFLKDLMEGEQEQPGVIDYITDSDGSKRPLICWTSHSKSGDISAGIAIALPVGKWRKDNLIIQALTTGLGMIVQRMGSILMEVIERREGLGFENLGLVMRVLAHELNNDLQGALNCMDAQSEKTSSTDASMVKYLRPFLTRAGYWTNLMREAPFLADKVLPFERNVVSLSDVLRETLQEVRPAWPDVMFIVEAGDEINVVGDHHLRSILRNMLHNAASFTPMEGSVEVRVQEDGEFARVYVEDEGPGVDPGDVDKIFAPLESMREDRKVGIRVDYGMGVGLTVSRAIARAYGGELRCHSNREESGGLFEVVLPLADPEDIKAEEGSSRGNA